MGAFFSTKDECKRYISDNDLEAIAIPRYSEDDGELLGWCIEYV